MSLAEETRVGIARYLADLWGEAVDVGEVSFASAGARRRNALCRARRESGEEIELCATIITVAAMQVLPIEIEASHLQLAEKAGLPVPHVYGVSTDESYLGGPFFVSSQVHGETIPRRILRLARDTPGLGVTVGEQMGEALARLHAASAEEAHAEISRPDGDDPVGGALERVGRQVSAMLHPSPTLALVHCWLDRNRPPAPERLCVVHGDFRNGNVSIDESGLTGVLDWEICHLGDPVEDLAWVCQRMWRFRNDRLEVGGLAGRDALRRGYERAGGRWNEETFFWWKVFGGLRWAVGLHDQARAHLDGSVPSVIMAASGRRVCELEYDLLRLLEDQLTL